MASSPIQSYEERKDPEIIEEMLCEAQDREDLNDWEEEFIENLIRKTDKQNIPELTQPQYNTIKKITERDDPVEVW